MSLVIVYCLNKSDCSILLVLWSNLDLWTLIVPCCSVWAHVIHLVYSPSGRFSIWQFEMSSCPALSAIAPLIDSWHTSCAYHSVMFVSLWLSSKPRPSLRTNIHPRQIHLCGFSSTVKPHYRCQVEHFNYFSILFVLNSLQCWQYTQPESLQTYPSVRSSVHCLFD